MNDESVDRYTGSFKMVVCCVCGTAFKMEQALFNYRSKDHGTFTCPNGHPQHLKESEEDKDAIIAAKDKKIAELTSQLESLQIEHRKLKCDILAYKNDPKDESFWKRIGLT